MQSFQDTPTPRNTAVAIKLPASESRGGVSPAAQRVLRNTYGLLALTLLFSAGTAAISVAMKLPHPGILITLVGYFGLLFLVHKLQDSAWGIGAVFALTGFMGVTLGPLLTQSLALPGGAQTMMLAIGATGAVFLALSGWVLTTRRDLSAMGGFLFAGMVIALVGAVAAAFVQVPALSLAIAALVALLSAGLIMFETSRILHGGETNYVMATVGLYVSVFNLFTSLLSLFGFGNGND